MSLSFAVAITTRNRREDLEQTCLVLKKLVPPPDEVIITTDGCTDDTVAFLEERYPEFKLIINKTSQGSIPSRDTMMREAKSDILVSFDDDSYPMDMDFLAKVETFFLEQPKLAAITFPQHSEEFPETLTQTDFGPSRYVGSYPSSGVVIRRSVFLELGGYPRFFFHAYEEPDFALRCVCNGYQVLYETSIRIRHHYSQRQRNEMRMHHLHARNEFWSALMRCPFPAVIGVIIFRMIRQGGYAFRRGFQWLICEPKWWLGAIRGIGVCLKNRKPLNWKCYLNWMRLLREPVYSEKEWSERFEQS